MFDPFLYVPLPIPPNKMSFEVIFYARDELTAMCTGCIRFHVKLPYDATAGQLLNMISQKTNVSPKSVNT